MNSARHTALLKIVLVVAVLAVLYALFAPSARGMGRPGPASAAVREALAPGADDDARAVGPLAVATA